MTVYLRGQESSMTSDHVQNWHEYIFIVKRYINPCTWLDGS
jgi:hypothetical protein